MKTGRMKRKMSGLMAIVTLMSSLTAPFHVLAESVEEEKIPVLSRSEIFLMIKRLLGQGHLGLILAAILM